MNSFALIKMFLFIYLFCIFNSSKISQPQRLNYSHSINLRETSEDLLRPVKNGLDFKTEAGKHESTRKETHARLVRRGYS